MINVLKYISSHDIYLSKLINHKQFTKIKNYLNNENIKFEDVVILYSEIYIELVSRDPIYQMDIFISGNQINDLLKLTNTTNYRISPNISSPLNIILILSNRTNEIHKPINP